MYYKCQCPSRLPPRYLPVLGGDDAPPFMVMGCDVTHPEGGVRAFRDVDAPASVAAVVAARDMALGNGYGSTGGRPGQRS